MTSKITNLVAAQDAHISRILNATPYNENNPMGDLTLLRRKIATLRASRKQYRKDLQRLGFNLEQTTITMIDAEDMAKLEDAASEED